MFKSYGVGGGGGGLQHFSVSPRPLGFGFWGLGAKGLGSGLDNYKIRIFIHFSETRPLLQILTNVRKPHLHYSNEP